MSRENSAFGNRGGGGGGGLNKIGRAFTFSCAWFAAKGALVQFTENEPYRTPLCYGTTFS